MSASSAADFVTRQPIVTGSALTYSADGAAWRIPSWRKNRTLSSIPIRPVAMPRSRKICATRSYGLSSSSQVRMSSPNRISSRARSSSNFGEIYAGSPRAGRTMANIRSLFPHRTPV